MKIRSLSLLTTAIVGMGWASTVMAQDQAVAPADAPATGKDQKAKDAGKSGSDEILVVGTRNAIAKSIDTKRASAAHIDVITAEDVDRYPDVNVAESLSRLPGVTIDRSAGGEGSKVAINGIDSRLINVEFNGMPIATTESGVNSRDTGRSFNFRTLAPELVGSVEVYKTAEARLDEGGIGGSIMVNSRLPLELPSNTLSATATYNMNLRNKEKDPRASLLYSWHTKDKTFGILASVAYNKSVLGSGSITVGYQNVCNASGWGGCTNGTFNDPSQLPTVSSGPAITESMLTPAYVLVQSSVANSERITGYLAVQARPSDNFSVEGTALRIWSDFSNYTTTFQTDLSVPWNQSNAYDSATAAPTKASSVTTIDAGITGGTGDFAVRTDENYQRSKLNTEVYNLRLRWAPGPLELVGNAGITQATGGVQPQYYLSFYGNTSGTFAFSPNSSSETLDVAATDPNLFKTRAAGQQAGFVKTAESLDRYTYGKLDGTLHIDSGPIESLLFGGRLQKHTSLNTPHFYNTVFDQAGTMSSYDTYVIPPSTLSGLGASGDFTSFVGLTQQAIIDYSVSNVSPGNANGDYRDAGNLWNTHETTKSAYAQLNFRSAHWGGNLGLRYAHTENEQTYRSTMDYTPWYEEMITERRSYDDWLPAANFYYDATDNFKIRLNAAKVVSRPSFYDMSGQIEYSLDRYSTSGPFFGGSGGNPDLKPYRAWNYNASFEWYFAHNSLLSLDLFYDDVESYIVRKYTFIDVTLPDAAIQYCNDNAVFCNGKVSRNETMLINAPFNGSSAKIKGVSLGLVTDIAYGFGIQANGTMLDQDYGSYTDAYNQSGDLPMPYLSKWSFTVSPYFEKGPYQARISYTYRSKYVTQVGSEVAAPQYIDGWGQLDAQASYNLNDRLRINISGQNLLDSREQPFTNGGLPLGFARFGTRVSLGVTYRIF